MMLIRHELSTLANRYHVGRNFESPIWLPVRTLSLIVRMICSELLLSIAHALAIHGLHRGFWREAQRVQEKRFWASLPSSLRIAWKGVLKTRQFLSVRLEVMRWISSSDRRSMSM
jgi:hypothetical protein